MGDRLRSNQAPEAPGTAFSEASGLGTGVTFQLPWGAVSVAEAYQSSRALAYLRWLFRNHPGELPLARLLGEAPYLRKGDYRL